MDDLISRQAAIEAVMECYDNDELFEVYEEKLRELPPSQPEQLGANLAEVGTDCISRQAAIVALGTITVYKGSIPFDTAMMRIEQLPPANTSETPNSSDTISRQAAIERATKEHDFFRGAVTVSDKARRDELLNVMCWLGELPSVKPTPDQNGDLWITVPDIDKVMRIYVQESKSKFCRIFYEER